ncbi:MAG TPA: hypothetical protein VIX63_04705 [Vicinamibacterales bacterium]
MPHMSGDHAHRLWSLPMPELWFREFIDGDAAGQPLEHAVVRVAREDQGPRALVPGPSGS